MNVRASLKSGYISTVATGVLLCALSAASLGCAVAACYGMLEQEPAATPALPAIPVAAGAPRSPAPVAQPMAGVAEPVRCTGSHAARARRNLQGACRIADLPAV